MHAFVVCLLEGEYADTASSRILMNTIQGHTAQWTAGFLSEVT